MVYALYPYRASLHYGIMCLKRLNYDRKELERRRDDFQHDIKGMNKWTMHSLKLWREEHYLVAVPVICILVAGMCEVNSWALLCQIHLKGRRPAELQHNTWTWHSCHSFLKSFIFIAKDTRTNCTRHTHTHTLKHITHGIVQTESRLASCAKWSCSTYTVT